MPLLNTIPGARTPDGKLVLALWLGTRLIRQFRTGIRTNAATNPRAVSTGADGWMNTRWFGGTPSTGTYTYETGLTGPTADITTARRKTWTVAGGGNNDTGFEVRASSTTYFPVTPGAFDVTLGGPEDGLVKAMQQRVSFLDRTAAGGAVAIGGTMSGTMIPVVAANTWQRISYLVIVPAGAFGMRVFCDTMGQAGNPSWAVGDTLDGTGLVIERVVVGSYFDGGTPDTAGTVYDWAGTPHASVSTATGSQFRTNRATNPAAVETGATGWVTSRAFGTGGNGTYGWATGQVGPTPDTTTVRRKTWTTAPTNNTASGFNVTDTSTTYFPVTPGDTITVSAYLRVTSATSKPMQIAVAYYDRTAYTGAVFIGSTNGPPVIGQPGIWQRVSYTGEIPAGAYGVRVIPDVNSGTTDLWQVGDVLDCTGLLIETGPPMPYFDGATPDTLPFHDYAWTGTPHASTATDTYYE